MSQVPLVRTIETNAAAQTTALGRALGEQVAAGTVIELLGPLGAGKTHFVHGLAAGLGVAGGVRSPTFTICHEHPGTCPLYHIDAYRLEDPLELLHHGWDEMRSGGVVAVEWGERIRELLPTDRIQLCLEHIGGSRRRIDLHATGAFRALIEKLPSPDEGPEQEAKSR
ncbi:MAG: tRNA (adenosine(37)-N6)-threonylcarbamoyltransferase complex ATPase subunit type 1 TsaE [Planctomycetota bacterium]